MNEDENAIKNYKTNNLHIYVVYPRAASTKEKGKWDVFEEVYVRNSLKNNLLDSATIVLDCGNMTVRKDRTEQQQGFYHYLTYLAQNHNEPANIKDYIDRVYNAQYQLEELEQNNDTSDTVDAIEENPEYSE